MLYNAKKRVLRQVFEWQIREVINTPPMPVVDAPWSIVSMVAKPDILMYLLSMKAFYRKLGRGKLVAIIDRDTPAASRAILEQHFPGLQFVILEDIDPSPCQRGGTWERLVHVVRCSEQEYIIQLDCDTLVTGSDIDEVVHCVEANVAFAYADNGWSIKSLAEISQDANQINSDYVGIVLERCFAGWPDADRLKYVRASSGFVGFAKGGASLQSLEWFHEQMKRSLGPRWRDWGTEQSGSNFVAANAPDIRILPFPEYATYPQAGLEAQAKFYHFIGSSRFSKHYFAKKGREIIAELAGV